MGVIPRPGPAANRDAWKEFRASKLLRLLPGDEGFVVWAQGKLAFWEMIRDRIQVYWHGFDPVYAAQMLGELEESFPVVLEEF